MSTVGEGLVRMIHKAGYLSIVVLGKGVQHMPPSKQAIPAAYPFCGLGLSYIWWVTLGFQPARLSPGNRFLGTEPFIATG